MSTNTLPGGDPQISVDDPSTTQGGYDSLEKDFQRVLSELVSDKSLEKFRIEYEKLHSALQRSHENEKKLLSKCRELNDELINNASKVGVAMKLSSEDQNSIALLKNEIDKAWKMVDVAQEKEKKAKRTIQQLRGEITKLSKVVTDGAGFNIGQETTVNELLRMKEELSKELDSANKKLQSQQTEISELQVELVSNEENKSKYESQISELAKQLNKTKQDLQRYSRRAERSEKQLLDLKTHLDQTAVRMDSQTEQLKQKDDALMNLKQMIKQRDDNIRRMTSEFEALKMQSQELMEQLELNKEEEMILSKEKADLNAMIKQKENEVFRVKQDVIHWRKQSDKSLKEAERQKHKLSDSEKQRSKLRDILQEIKRDLVLEEKSKRDDKRVMDDLNLDLKKLTSSFQLNKKKNQSLLFEIKTLKAKVRELEQDLTASKAKIDELNKGNANLEKKSERLSATSNQYHSKAKKLQNEISVLNMEQNDMTNTIREERNKLKQQQQIYENIRSERNLFSQNLNEAQDEIAEMKRKFKIMSHQIEQYKEETTNKDKALIKQHFEIKELRENAKSLEKQKVKKDEILQSAEKLLSAQDTEIKTLRRTLSEAESTQKSQKQVFDAVVDERDILGAQLIRRNDELALLYDKMRLMESTLEKGEVEYRCMLDDCQNLKLQLKDTRRQLTIRNAQCENMNKLKYEIHHLQRELLHEKTKCKALSEELENPINVHRWRKLSGSDPDQYESIQKIQTLQKRLIAKTEEIVEKDLIIKEKERLYVELKNILARQPGPEVIEQLNIYQNTLKQRARQIKSNTAELNMLQTQLNQYKFDCQQLTQQLIVMKKKYYQQKKKEQLWKEQTRQNPGVDVIPLQSSTNSLHSSSENPKQNGHDKSNDHHHQQDDNKENNAAEDTVTGSDHKQHHNEQQEASRSDNAAGGSQMKE